MSDWKNIMSDTEYKLPLTVTDIENILPHRFPFLLVDRVIEIEGDQRLVAIKHISASDMVLQGHFPGNPVTPGVCLVQMATEILEQKYSKKFLLSEAVNIKFRKTVGPNDEPSFVFTKLVFEENLLKTSVSIEDGEDPYVKMSLIYKVSD